MSMRCAAPAMPCGGGDQRRGVPVSASRRVGPRTVVPGFVCEYAFAFPAIRSRTRRASGAGAGSRATLAGTLDGPSTPRAEADTAARRPAPGDADADPPRARVHARHLPRRGYALPPPVASKHGKGRSSMLVPASRSVSRVRCRVTVGPGAIGSFGGRERRNAKIFERNEDFS